MKKDDTQHNLGAAIPNLNQIQHITPPAHVTTDAQADIDNLKNSYDNFLYVSKAFPNTNINSLIAKGRIYGLNPVPINGLVY